MNDSSERQRSLAQKVYARLAASRFLTFSLLLNLIIVLLVGSAVMVQQMKKPDFGAEGEFTFTQTEDPSNAPPEPPQSPEVSTGEPAQPSAGAPISAPALEEIVAKGDGPSNLASIPLPSVKDLPARIGEANRVQPISSVPIGNLPPSMSARPGGTGYTKAVALNKMSRESEKAVFNGLTWLKEHQSKDGSWAGANRTAMTGLALLCFLGNGNTPETPGFGPTVKRGVDWLLEKGLGGQGALAGSAGTFSQTDVYEHAIGAYALSEYYTMTRDDRVKDVLTQAVTYIVQGQAPDGGWLYAYAKVGDSDTSVSGWQIQALKAAHLTGLNIPGVDEALNKSMLNLRRVQNEKGAFGYHSAADARYSLTGVGVLCTYFWKGEKDKSVRDGMKYMIDTTEKENPIEYNGGKADLYAWYYDTQACLLYGGEAWNKWNRWFQTEITDHQNPDGSWPPTGNKAPVGGLENDSKEVGPYYRTSLCVLMLEVFYRYVPTGTAPGTRQQL